MSAEPFHLPDLNENVTVAGNTGVSTRWALVDDKLAAEFLTANTHNRPMRRHNAERMAADKRAGRFTLDHAGIAFNINGVLADGQHRLQAIVDTKIPQWLLITVGLQPEAQGNIDSGAKRLAADFMDGTHKSTRAAAIRILITVANLNGLISTAGMATAQRGITNAAIHNFDPATSQMLQERAQLSRMASKSTFLFGAGPLLAASVVYSDTGEAFLSGMAEMTGLAPDDPRLAVIRFKPHKGAQTVVAAYMAIKAASYFATGRPMNRLRAKNDEKMTVPVNLAWRS